MPQKYGRQKIWLSKGGYLKIGDKQQRASDNMGKNGGGRHNAYPYETRLKFL